MEAKAEDAYESAVVDVAAHGIEGEHGEGENEKGDGEENCEPAESLPANGGT